MGKENTIYTGGTRKTINFNGNNNNFKNPKSSGFSFGVVTAVNPETKEIVYHTLEDNQGLVTGKASPLYKNNIKLPDVGYLVPIVMGPRNDSGVFTNQYSKTPYYMDPVGVWQTVDQNKITRQPGISPTSNELTVSTNNIINSELGFPSSNRNIDPFNSSNSSDILNTNQDASFAPLDVDVILGAGHDNIKNPGYYSVTQQIALLRKPWLENQSILGFRYTDWEPIKKAIIKNPKACVVLFSASGGQFADQAASVMSDLNKLFILEPFFSDGKDGKSNQRNIKAAIQRGLSPSNVHVGKSMGRGNGIIPNPTYTKLNDHWDALSYIGKFVLANLATDIMSNKQFYSPIP